MSMWQSQVCLMQGAKDAMTYFIFILLKFDPTTCLLVQSWGCYETNRSTALISSFCICSILSIYDRSNYKKILRMYMILHDIVFAKNDDIIMIFVGSDKFFDG